MYLKRNRRLKDGKEHVYWNIVESKRCAGGKVVQRQVLYLGEISDGQRESWSRVIEAFGPTQLAMFSADRAVPDHGQGYGIAVRLDAMELHRPRQWGACWLAATLYEQLGLDRFWADRLPASREIAKERAMRRRQLKWLWVRLKQLQAMKLTREELLMKLGAARAKARAARRLVDVEVVPRGSSFSYTLNRKKLRQARRREGRYLLRTNLCGRQPAELWQFYIQLTEIEAAGQMKGQRQAAEIDLQMDFRREATARTAERLIFCPFCAGCRNMGAHDVESNICTRCAVPLMAASESKHRLESPLSSSIARTVSRRCSNARNFPEEPAT